MDRELLQEWKKIFRQLMIPLLAIFPDEIQRPLALHLKNPKASSSSDHNLLASLRLFDKQKIITISEIPNGTVFYTASGKPFLKEKKLRKRFFDFLIILVRVLHTHNQ